jgi:general secretion pathway protein I
LPRGNRSGERGFTLLEVLVSFVILAISLGVLLEVFSSGVGRADDGEQQRRAVLLAQSLLARIGTEEPLGPGERSGTADGLRWHESVVALLIDPKQPPLVARPFHVAVTVTWSRGRGAEESVALDSLRLGLAQ